MLLECNSRPRASCWAFSDGSVHGRFRTRHHAGVELRLWWAAGASSAGGSYRGAPVKQSGEGRRCISCSITRRRQDSCAAVWIAHRCSLLRPCALRPRSFRRPPLDVDGCYEPFNLAQSQIRSKLAPGGPARHGRPRNAASPIRNCQNRKARDLDSSAEPRRLQHRHASRLPASRANQRSLRPR